MARKKTVPTEPEFLDAETGEVPQPPESESPAEGIQDDTLTGDVSGDGEIPNNGLPPDGEEFPVAQKGDSPWAEETEMEGIGDGESPPGDLPSEESDYGAILQAMEGTTPIEEVPLMLDSGTEQELPASEPVEPIPAEGAFSAATAAAEFGGEASARSAPSPVVNARRERVLTIDAHSEVQTQEDLDDITWHEIQNAYRTRRILTGTLDGIERTDSGLTLAVVSYKGFRVAIPMKEMMLHTGPVPADVEYVEWMGQLQRILSSRLGSEIDFVVKGIENKSRSIVASRREAMLRKRKTFYMDANELGEHMIYEGRVVQARVVAVAEKIIRVEVFGVECSIVARGLSWLWIGSARDHFSVGDRILVRVLKIDRTDVENLSIQVDARSVLGIDNGENLKKCQPQSRYAGRVTDVRKGVVFIRLNNGVNAIAHSCYDLRTPGKKDDVSFAVTHLDEEQGVAVGIITRIIKQNL